MAGYCFLDGMEALLEKLRTEGYSMHAFTNYPCWYSPSIPALPPVLITVSITVLWAHARFRSSDTWGGNDGRYQMIESKLKLSKYLPWTFVSCHTGEGLGFGFKV